MALAQYIAGMGFSNVGLGIVHSMAHPLGALYDTPHGVANALLLPYVMEFNAPAAGEKYRSIALAMGIGGSGDAKDEDPTQAVIAALTGSHGGTTAGDTGVYGEATSATGAVYGVQGVSASTGGAGVFGSTAATTGRPGSSATR